MSDYLLGIDLGTSACKVAVFTPSGGLVASAACGFDVFYPQVGWAEQDPDQWWAAVCRATKAALEAGGIPPGDIAGVGIDGQSWAAVAVDSAGEALTRTPIWMDTRAGSICDALNARIGGDNIFKLACNSLQPSYTTAKILWYKENCPQIYGKINKILQANGFVAYRLTGQMSHDLSQGYGLHCFDMRRGCWDEAMARELGIPRAFLPDLAASDAIIGAVTPSAARLTGLAPGTPVVAGGLDAACGALGVGVLRSGETQEQGGQAGGMSICVDQYTAHPALILGRHVVPGRWLLQGGTVGGGGVMRWFEQEFADHERARAADMGQPSLEQLNQLGAAVPAGCDGLVMLPYMAGERSPIWDPQAKGVLYGLDFSKTKGHMLRACMESVAYSLRHNLEVAHAAGADAKVLRAMGGAANSHLWTQIKADVTGKTVVVPSSDTATTWGAAMLAGVGLGVYSGYDQAVALSIRETRRHEPNAELKPIYDKNYATYLNLYSSLKCLMQET